MESFASLRLCVEIVVRIGAGCHGVDGAGGGSVRVGQRIDPTQVVPGKPGHIREKFLR